MQQREAWSDADEARQQELAKAYKHVLDPLIESVVALALQGIHNGELDSLGPDGLSTQVGFFVNGIAEEAAYLLQPANENFRREVNERIRDDQWYIMDYLNDTIMQRLDEEDLF